MLTYERTIFLSILAPKSQLFERVVYNELNLFDFSALKSKLVNLLDTDSIIIKNMVDQRYCLRSHIFTDFV